VDRLPDWPSSSRSGGVAAEVVQGKNDAVPILGHQCMGRGGGDALDLQVLFQGFEERLDLPAFLVDHGNRVGLRPVVRSQKNQGFAGMLRCGATHADASPRLPKSVRQID
jgi:hypothetical protein